MGTNECSQSSSKSSWDSQDFGDISMLLKMAHFRKSTGPWWVNGAICAMATSLVILLKLDSNQIFFSLCDLEIWWMT